MCASLHPWLAYAYTLIAAFSRSVAARGGMDARVYHQPDGQAPHLLSRDILRDLLHFDDDVRRRTHVRWLPCGASRPARPNARANRAAARPWRLQVNKKDLRGARSSERDKGGELGLINSVSPTHCFTALLCCVVTFRRSTHVPFPSFKTRSSGAIRSFKANPTALRVRFEGFFLAPCSMLLAFALRAMTALKLSYYYD